MRNSPLSCVHSFQFLLANGSVLFCRKYLLHLFLFLTGFLCVLVHSSYAVYFCFLSFLMRCLLSHRTICWTSHKSHVRTLWHDPPRAVPNTEHTSLSNRIEPNCCLSEFEHDADNIKENTRFLIKFYITIYCCIHTSYMFIILRIVCVW